MKRRPRDLSGHQRARRRLAADAGWGSGRRGDALIRLSRSQSLGHEPDHDGAISVETATLRERPDGPQNAYLRDEEVCPPWFPLLSPVLPGGANGATDGPHLSTTESVR
jgi:hypothetical protein